VYLKITNTPSLFWSHGVTIEKTTINNIIKYMFLNFFSHGGFVYGKTAKHIMEKKGFKKKIDVIYNSLNYEIQNKLYSSKASLADKFNSCKPYIIFSGRIEERKQLKLLFDAILMLKNKEEHISLIIIGEGNYKELLIAYAKLLKISNQVLFYGSCYDEEQLSVLYKNSFVCVIPGAVGLGAIHSFTYGTPVITNDNIDSHGPEIEALKDGVTGAFYKYSNLESLSNKILLFKNMSKAESKEYNRQCLKIVADKYNPKNQYLIIKERILNINK
jgi:glycosyltransferase involved in cell wall biosynthesis